jgi:hypothetical protein
MTRSDLCTAVYCLSSPQEISELDRQLSNLNSHPADLAGLRELYSASNRLLPVYCLSFCRKSVKWTGSSMTSTAT